MRGYSCVAIFSDGEAKRRTSQTRAYTHAWRVVTKRALAAKFGFSEDADLARKAANSHATLMRNEPYPDEVISVEVVAVEPTTR